MFCPGVPGFPGREEGLASLRLRREELFRQEKEEAAQKNLSNFISVFLSTVPAFRACNTSNTFPDLLRKLDKETLSESGECELNKAGEMLWGIELLSETCKILINLCCQYKTQA